MATFAGQSILIHGFIRQIETILNNQQTVPSELKRLCCKFYSIQIMLWFNSINIPTQFQLVDLHNNVISMLIPDSESYIFRYIKTACHIPNITSIISIKHDVLNKNQNYDGIFHCSNRMYYFTMFSSNITVPQNIECHTFFHGFGPKVNTSGHAPQQLLYCDQRHSIICESNGILQELKLNKLNLRRANVSFSQIKNNVKTFDMSYNEWLSMRDIHNEQKLFVMKCWERTSIYVSNYNENIDIPLPLCKKVECKIFGLDFYRWINLKPYEYEVYSDDINAFQFKVGISKYNYYDTNNVYIVSNTGHTAKYNLIKNRWTTLNVDYQLHQSFSHSPKVWFDGANVLYCGYDKYIGFFDLRENKNWVQIGMEYVNNKISANLALV